MHFWTSPNFFHSTALFSLFIANVWITRTYFAEVANILLPASFGVCIYFISFFLVCSFISLQLLSVITAVYYIWLGSLFSFSLMSLFFHSSFYVVDIELSWTSCATQITQSGIQLNEWPSRHWSHHHCRLYLKSEHKKPNKKWEELKLICDFVVCT